MPGDHAIAAAAAVDAATTTATTAPASNLPILSGHQHNQHYSQTLHHLAPAHQQHSTSPQQDQHGFHSHHHPHHHDHLQQYGQRQNPKYGMTAAPDAPGETTDERKRRLARERQRRHREKVRQNAANVPSITAATAHSVPSPTGANGRAASVTNGPIGIGDSSTVPGVSEVEAAAQNPAFREAASAVQPRSRRSHDASSLAHSVRHPREPTDLHMARTLNSVPTTGAPTSSAAAVVHAMHAGNTTAAVTANPFTVPASSNHSDEARRHAQQARLIQELRQPSSKGHADYGAQGGGQLPTTYAATQHDEAPDLAGRAAHSHSHHHVSQIRSDKDQRDLMNGLEGHHGAQRMAPEHQQQALQDRASPRVTNRMQQLPPAALLPGSLQSPFELSPHGTSRPLSSQFLKPPTSLTVEAQGHHGHSAPQHAQRHGTERPLSLPPTAPATPGSLMMRTLHAPFPGQASGSPTIDGSGYTTAQPPRVESHASYQTPPAASAAPHSNPAQSPSLVGAQLSGAGSVGHDREQAFHSGQASGLLPGSVKHAATMEDVHTRSSRSSRGASGAIEKKSLGRAEADEKQASSGHTDGIRLLPASTGGRDNNVRMSRRASSGATPATASDVASLHAREVLRQSSLVAASAQHLAQPEHNGPSLHGYERAGAGSAAHPSANVRDGHLTLPIGVTALPPAHAHGDPTTVTGQAHGQAAHQGATWQAASSSPAARSASSPSREVSPPYCFGDLDYSDATKRGQPGRVSGEDGQNNGNTGSGAGLAGSIVDPTVPATSVQSDEISKPGEGKDENETTGGLDESPAETSEGRKRRLARERQRRRRKRLRKETGAEVSGVASGASGVASGVGGAGEELESAAPESTSFAPSGAASLMPFPPGFGEFASVAAGNAAGPAAAGPPRPHSYPSARQKASGKASLSTPGSGPTADVLTASVDAVDTATPETAASLTRLAGPSTSELAPRHDGAMTGAYDGGGAAQGAPTSSGAHRRFAAKPRRGGEAPGDSRRSNGPSPGEVDRAGPGSFSMSGARSAEREAAEQQLGGDDNGDRGPQSGIKALARKASSVGDEDKPKTPQTNGLHGKTASSRSVPPINPNETPEDRKRRLARDRQRKRRDKLRMSASGGLAAGADSSRRGSLEMTPPNGSVSKDPTALHSLRAGSRSEDENDTADGSGAVRGDGNRDAVSRARATGRDDGTRAAIHARRSASLAEASQLMQFSGVPEQSSTQGVGLESGSRLGTRAQSRRGSSAGVEGSRDGPRSSARNGASCTSQESERNRRERLANNRRALLDGASGNSSRSMRASERNGKQPDHEEYGHGGSSRQAARGLSHGGTGSRVAAPGMSRQTSTTPVYRKASWDGGFPSEAQARFAVEDATQAFRMHLNQLPVPQRTYVLQESVIALAAKDPYLRELLGGTPQRG